MQPEGSEEAGKKCPYCGFARVDEATACSRCGTAGESAGNKAQSIDPGTALAKGQFRLELHLQESGTIAKKVVTSLGGLKRGVLSVSPEGLLLEQRLTFLGSVLIGLVSLVLMGVVGSMVLSALNAPYVPWVAVVSQVSVVTALVVPPIAAWRTRRFKQWFAISEMKEVTMLNRVFEFGFRDGSEREDHLARSVDFAAADSSQSKPRTKGRLRFTVHSRGDTLSLASALGDLGFVVSESLPKEQVEFSRQLAVATPTAWVTKLLLVVNVLAFLATVIAAGGLFSFPNPTLIASGADFGPLTVTALQIWRLFTCCFVHIGLMHLLFNMYALYQAGTAAERLFGNGMFLGLYLACGVGSSLVSVWWNPLSVSVGASGAIFGIYGALLGYLARERGGIPRDTAAEILKGAVVVIGWSVVYAVNNAVQDSMASLQSTMQNGQSAYTVGPRIDQAAHIGGLILGCVFGFLAARPLERELRAQLLPKRTAALAVGCTLSFLLLGTLAQNSVSRSPEVPSKLALIYYHGIGVETNLGKAIVWTQRGANQGSAEAQRLLGSAYYLGRGVPRNRELAVEWLTKAADQGDAQAEKVLAAIYSEDKTPSKFSVATQGRLRRLSNGGDPNAKAALEHGELARMQQISAQVSNSIRTNWSQISTNQDAMADQVRSLQQAMQQGAKETTGQRKQLLEANSALVARTLEVSRRLQGSCDLLDKAMDFKAVQTAPALEAKGTILSRAIQEMKEPRQFYANYLRSYQQVLNEHQLDPRVTRAVLESAGPKLELYQKSMVSLFAAFDDVTANLAGIHGFLKQNWGTWRADAKGAFQFETVEMRQQFDQHNQKLVASLLQFQKVGQQIQSRNPLAPVPADGEQSAR